MKDKIYYAISKGGYTKKVKVEKLKFTIEEFNDIKDDFESFDDFVNYCLDDYTGVVEQSFGTCLFLTEKELENIKKM